MSTIQRVAITVLGGIVGAFVAGGIVYSIQLAGFSPPNPIQGGLTLLVVIGAGILIWRWTGASQDVVSVSSEPIVIENVPLSRCPKSILNWINNEETPFARFLTIRTSGNKYEYTITGVASNEKTIARITRQPLPPYKPETAN